MFKPPEINDQLLYKKTINILYNIPAMARYLPTLITTLFIFFIPFSHIAAEVIQIDSDFNGKFDQWHHKSKEGKIIKIQFDKNEDGKVDQVDKYNSNEKPLQVEIDKN